jgi:3'(2'), 5'-bisphosphate nucleotidase
MPADGEAAASALTPTLSRKRERELTLLETAIAAARRGAVEIMRVYAGEFAVTHKEDRSPVTEADHESQRVIVEVLGATGIPIISEEAALPSGVPERFWLVDPLDGTKEFVARRGEFSVNIGLIEKDRPVLGVVHAPVTGVTYAAADGHAMRNGEKIRARPTPLSVVVVHSRSHSDSTKLAAWFEENRISVGARLVAGSALKFCLIADGTADLYPRLGPTSEWDTAAGQAILEAAGGTVTDLAGAPLRYGKPNFLNTGFIARGRQA